MTVRDENGFCTEMTEPLGRSFSVAKCQRDSRHYNLRLPKPTSGLNPSRL
jgi:hypothetical protein